MYLDSTQALVAQLVEYPPGTQCVQGGQSDCSGCISLPFVMFMYIYITLSGRIRVYMYIVDDLEMYIHVHVYMYVHVHVATRTRTLKSTLSYTLHTACVFVTGES